MAHESPACEPIIPIRPSYWITNWPDYNRALVRRGEVTLWLHGDVLRDWRAAGGKGKRYSDAAILCALSLRAVFRMPLRQTQGFVHSLIALLGLTIPVPHYSTLVRRAADLVVPQLVRGRQDGPLHLVIDSTGLKLFGEGEWKMRQHGPQSSLRQTQGLGATLHLAVDTEAGEILAHSLTPSSRHDSPEMPGLLAKVKEPVAVVCADKGYDSFDCHAAILARGARPVVPPRIGAAITPPPDRKDAPKTRGEAVRRITEIGVKLWKVETGYHRRSLAETAMARTKAIIGPSIKSRKAATHITEAAIAVRCINTLTALGMPITVKIA